jgi:hypothetical protein
MIKEHRKKAVSNSIYEAIFMLTLKPGKENTRKQKTSIPHENILKVFFNT